MYGGYTWGAGGDIYVGLDLPKNSFTAFEFFANTFIHKYSERDILGGLAYKPCLYKGVNSFFRLRAAAEIGTTTHKFIAGGHIGCEYVIGLSPRFDLAIIPQGGYYFNSVQKWRFMTLAGLRCNF
jgi:hypothetical protein